MTKTVVYDLVEQMDNPQRAIDFYSTEIDLGWLGDQLPTQVVKTRHFIPRTAI